MALDLISSTAVILTDSRFGTHESMCWNHAGSALTSVAIQRNTFRVFPYRLTISGASCDADRDFNGGRGCGAPASRVDAGPRECARDEILLAKSASLRRRIRPAAGLRRAAREVRARWRFVP